MTLTQPAYQDASLQHVFAEVKKRHRTRGPAHVLVVEDEPLTRRIVTHALKESYAMISACNAREAVEDYLMYAPDVVFLDIGLPDSDGFWVLNEILALDAEAFVVMFSGNSYPENVARALDAGAKGFIAKPFKKEALEGYIRGSVLYQRQSGG